MKLRPRAAPIVAESLHISRWHDTCLGRVPARSVAAPPAPSRGFFHFRGAALGRASGPAQAANGAARSRLSSRAVKSSPRFSPLTRLAYASPLLALCSRASCTDTPRRRVRPTPRRSSSRGDLRPREPSGAAADVRSRRPWLSRPASSDPCGSPSSPTCASRTRRRSVRRPGHRRGAAGRRSFDLRHATYDFIVKGGVAGTTSIKATMGSKDANGVPLSTTVELPVDVRDRSRADVRTFDVAQGTMAAGSRS